MIVPCPKLDDPGALWQSGLKLPPPTLRAILSGTSFRALSRQLCRFLRFQLNNAGGYLIWSCELARLVPRSLDGKRDRSRWKEHMEAAVEVRAYGHHDSVMPGFDILIRAVTTGCELSASTI